jgi:predicted TIM-barrel fold metal-dependent hydrolase
MGGWRSWDQAEQCLIGANVYLETSFSLDRLAPQRAVDMMHRHGIQRVLFGTDWPWADQKKEVQRLASLPLTDPQTRAILLGNAARLLRY